MKLALSLLFTMVMMMMNSWVCGIVLTTSTNVNHLGRRLLNNNDDVFEKEQQEFNKIVEKYEKEKKNFKHGPPTGTGSAATVVVDETTDQVETTTCDLPGFPGHAAPSCDPLKSKCCSGLYCRIDPQDPAQLLYTCQDSLDNDKNSTFPSGAFIHFAVSSMLMDEAADKMYNMMRNLRISSLKLRSAIETEFQHVEPGVMNHLIERAHEISLENKARHSKSSSDTKSTGKNDSFDWKKYAPPMPNQKNGVRKQKQQPQQQNNNNDYKNQYAKNYIPKTKNNLEITESEWQGTDDDLQALIDKTKSDLSELAEAFRARASQQAKNTEEEYLTIAQAKLLETASGLVASAEKILDKVKASSSTKSTPPTQTKTAYTVTTYHLQKLVFEAQNSASQAAAALQSLGANGKKSHLLPHAQSMSHVVDLLRASDQVMLIATSMKFEWGKFTPGDVNTGDRSPGTLDGPCGKTKQMNFGLCQEPLECIGVTTFSPGHCKKRLETKNNTMNDNLNNTSSDLVDKAGSLARDAVSSSLEVANQLRIVSSEIQLGIHSFIISSSSSSSRNSSSSSKEKGSLPDAAIEPSNQFTATAGTIVVITVGTGLGLLFLYSLYTFCLRRQSGYQRI